MIYSHTVFAEFVDRPNRFIAHVRVGGKEETVHVKNTGRCRELLISGRKVVLQRGDNPARKTRYDLIAVEKPGLGWVNIDSQIPNALVKEWLEERPAFFEDWTLLQPEKVYGNSRVDFYLEAPGRKILLEVKGCTLEVGGKGYFPDAPTERGSKHLRELKAALEEGYEAYLAFVIAMGGIEKVEANRATDPQFADALEEAMAAGVKVLFLPCEVKSDSLRIIGASLAGQE